MDIFIYIILLFPSLFTYILWNWLFKKFIKSPIKLAAFIWVGILISPFFFISIFWFWFYTTTYYPEEKFDKARWRKDKEKQFYMAQDLVNSKILLGKDSLVVKTFIGEPDWRTHPKNLWHFEMGRSDGFFWPVDHKLHIFFNKNKVDSVLYTSYHD